MPPVKQNAPRRVPRPPVNGFVHSRTRNQTELAEDYVEMIDDLIREKGEARTVDFYDLKGVGESVLTFFGQTGSFAPANFGPLQDGQSAEVQAGGGGIGMQLCHNNADLEAAFESVKRLGKNNFSDDGVFLEKFIASARHIEVQIFGDGKGTAVGPINTNPAASQAATNVAFSLRNP